jgi:hypothetical protein
MLTCATTGKNAGNGVWCGKLGDSIATLLKQQEARCAACRAAFDAELDQHDAF